MFGGMSGNQSNLVSSLVIALKMFQKFAFLAIKLTADQRSLKMNDEEDRSRIAYSDRSKPENRLKVYKMAMFKKIKYTNSCHNCVSVEFHPL